MNIKIKHITIVGTGFLGSSLALAIRSRFENISITGIDSAEKKLTQALKDQTIDHASHSLETVIEKTDLLILATPISAIREILKLIKKLHVKKELVLFDIGSSKVGIVEDMASLPSNICAIGGHPMTGPMTSGYKDPHPDMFFNRFFVITPSQRSTKIGIAWFKKFIETIGSSSVVVNALEHDEIMATVSHLPNLLSIPLLETVKNKDNDLYWMLSAGGYKRSTAQINENPDMWKSILFENKDFIASALKGLNQEINSMVEILETGNPDRINLLFDQANQAFREHLEIPEN